METQNKDELLKASFLEQYLHEATATQLVDINKILELHYKDFKDKLHKAGKDFSNDDDE
jgi:hypothetical protein